MEEIQEDVVSNEDASDTEVNKVREDQEIFDAFLAVFEEESDEVVKMEMLKAGAKIKSVSRLYNEYMVEIGAIASKEEKESVLSDIFADDNIDLSDEDDLDIAVESFCDHVKGSVVKTALLIIRAYGKKNHPDVVIFKNAIGKGKRRTGFRFIFYDALKSNPDMTEAEAKSLVDEKGSDNDKKAFSHYQAIRELVNAVSS